MEEGSSDVSPFDLERMFLGDFDMLFLAEVAVRTGIIYLFALLLVRFLGKRGQGQLSPFEFVIIIALGSAVGDPMFYADVPLVHSMIVITVVVVFNRGLDYAVSNSSKVEVFVESTPTCVVVDGRLELKDLDRERVAHDELFMVLRQSGVEQLGQVRRAYLEPSGQVSWFAYLPDDVRSGLPLQPRADPEFPERFSEGVAVPDAGTWVCTYCGETYPLEIGNEFPKCPRCEEGEWVKASVLGSEDKASDAAAR
ncbi:MAG TPA: DUF421 domain-containing protein [Dehalococcoidia bacterium]|nr:DUF421 domain-containing protein [Dehalococcoidia bacterium]